MVLLIISHSFSFVTNIKLNPPYKHAFITHLRMCNIPKLSSKGQEPRILGGETELLECAFMPCIPPPKQVNLLFTLQLHVTVVQVFCSLLD